MDLLILGIDGGERRLLDEWINAGKLPTFYQLFSQNGGRGNLKTCLPPITSPAWKCYSTGKTPGKLGVYEWLRADIEKGTLIDTDYSMYTSAEYWDYLADGDIRAGIVNMPTMFPPPDRTDIDIISGIPATINKKFTSSKNLETELLETIPNYRIKPNLLPAQATSDELVEEAKKLFELRFRSIDFLSNDRNCDLVHCTLFNTDMLQHYLWDQPDHLLNAYQKIDELLSEFHDRNPQTPILLFSDHGFVEIETLFKVNNWLQTRGDLTISKDENTIFSNVGLTHEKMKYIVHSLNLSLIAQKYVPEAVNDMIRRNLPSESGKTSLKDLEIDWKTTKAIMVGRGPVYVNDSKFNSSSDKSDYIKKLINDFESITDSNNNQLVKKAHKATELYTGERKYSPDIILEFSEGVDGTPNFGGETIGTEEDSDWVATHRTTGMYGVSGNLFNQFTDAPEIDIIDLAPTILYALEEDIPEDIDGQVRTGLFSKSSNPTTKEVKTQPSLGSNSNKNTEIDSDLEDTLRDLGYM